MSCGPYNYFFTNLANKVNVEIIMLLKDSPLNVKTITLKTGKEQSAVSHNLRRMHNCSIVTVKKKGRERIYSLNKEFILPILELVDKHAVNNCSRCLASEKGE